MGDIGPDSAIDILQDNYKVVRSVEQKDFECNCNDCAHLIRSFVGRQKHVDFHYEQQKRHFDVLRLKLLETAEEHFRKGYDDKGKATLKEARKLKFQFDESSTSLSFGECAIKARQGVFSFIPNIFDEDNIHCFKSR